MGLDLLSFEHALTPSSRGIGYGTVLHLARSGAKVYIAARDERSATTAIEQLKKGGLGPGHGEVLFLKLDLLDMRATKKAAEEFLAKETRLDILGESLSFDHLPVLTL